MTGHENEVDSMGMLAVNLCYRRKVRTEGVSLLMLAKLPPGQTILYLKEGIKVVVYSALLSLRCLIALPGDGSAGCL